MPYHVWFLQAAGHQPLLQALAIILGTFVLEDAATILAAMGAQEGDVSIPLALGALYCGVVLGDAGLYGVGWLARSIPWFERFVSPERVESARVWIRDRVVRVVLVSRFIPGLRLPTYTACGYLGAGFRRFVLASIGATLIWTSLLFGVSLHVGKLLIDYLGAWRWAGAIVFTLAVMLLLRGAARLQSARR